MTILMQMECGHIADVLGMYFGSRVWCGECRGERMTKDIITEEIHVKCQQCKYSRWMGLNSGLANVMANDHARARNHPHVDVKKEPRPASVKTREKLVKHGLLPKS